MEMMRKLHLTRAKRCYLSDGILFLNVPGLQVCQEQRLVDQRLLIIWFQKRRSKHYALIAFI